MIGARVKKHITYYIGLSFVLFSGFFLVTNLSYDQKLQMMIIVTTALLYAIWGILHHLIHHDLSSKIVIEYILISSLGMTFVLFVMKGV